MNLVTCDCSLPEDAFPWSTYHARMLNARVTPYERCPAVWTRDARLRAARVPAHYRDYNRASYRDWPATADAFLDDPTGFLCITGRNGSGKTHLAVAILDVLSERGLRCRYANAKDLSDEARILGEFGRVTEEAKAEQDACDTVDVLLLDDLFSEERFKSSHVRQRVEVRYRESRATLTTSMLTPHGYPDASGRATKPRMSDIDSDLASRVLSGRVIERGGVDRRIVPFSRTA